MSATSPTLRWSMDLSRPPEVWMARERSSPHLGTLRFAFSHAWGIHFHRDPVLLRIDGQAMTIAPRTVSVIPPAVTVELTWPRRSTHAFAHFDCGEQTDGPPNIRCLHPLAHRFDVMEERFMTVATSFATRSQRASARLWDLLWSMAEPNSPTVDDTHDPVKMVLRELEKRLHEPLGLTGLAADVGLSPNQLIRRFRRQVGATPIAYLRRRRMQVARYLLTETTLPIQAVAAQVGVADLQHFNKFIRRGLGQSPSAVRGGADG